MRKTTYHSTISNLEWLDDVHQQFSGFARDELAAASGQGIVHLPGEVHGLKGSRKIRHDTGQAEIESLLGAIPKAECLLDNFLYRSTDDSLTRYTDCHIFPMFGKPLGGNYHIVSHSSQHINIRIFHYVG